MRLEKRLLRLRGVIDDIIQSSTNVHGYCCNRLSTGFGQRGADDDAEGVVSGEVSVMRGALALFGSTIRVGLGSGSTGPEQLWFKM